MVDTVTPAFDPSWNGVAQRLDHLSKNAETAELRAHYRAELLVAQPTFVAMGIDVAGLPPLVVAAVPEGPPPIVTNNAYVPAQKTVYTPSSGDDSRGHVAGNLLATDPAKYDQYIQEACDYYGKVYGITIDPNLIKAHIWQESKGDPFALSQDGQLSRGLMQVSNSTGVPTAAILASITNPDGSKDPNIPAGGGDQYDPRTSIFTGVKYVALAMSGQMGDALTKSGLPPSELGNFPPRPLTQVEATRAYQGGPGVLANPTPASITYGEQLTGLALQFASGKAPSDPGYINPRTGRADPPYGTIV